VRVVRYAIGIDTGGTYTDAAIIDAAGRRVVAAAKALTTKGDLAVGVSEALGAVLAAAPDVRPPDIGFVSLSTTLATNAIVEGHGSPVGVVLVGFDERMAEKTEIARAIPGTRLLRAAGGHNHAGEEQAALDEAAIAAFLREAGPLVEAFAVAAHYSVRNPAHERRVAALVHELTGRPVTLSGELAQALDAPRRALTAALNARIVSRIVALIAAVRRGMAGRGIAAPLMIVKGDGSLATAEAIEERPIETILSGPAASVIGARFLSGLADFVLSDIGGTTTDIAVLEKGWPRLDREGAEVGGRRTMVQAIAMRTFGLGGDSEVDVDLDGAILLKPNRVVPLSLIGARFPAIVDGLRRVLDDPEGAPQAGRFVLRPFEQAEPELSAVPPRDREVLARVASEPRPVAAVARGPADQRALDRLVATGAVQLAAFTPSDAAHVLGLQGQWSREAALLGGLCLRRWKRMASPGSPEEAEAQARDFAQAVVDAVAAKSGRVVIETLAGGALDGAEPVIDAVVSGAGRFRGLAVSLRPLMPVVAVGGPAPVYYPEVGRRLGCEVVLPDHAAVANAVGAAVGVVKVRAVAEVTSPGPGVWRVHHRGAPASFTDGGEALTAARRFAEAEAREAAARAGGHAPQVELHVDRVDVPSLPGDNALVAATVIAECWGEPGG
jgi:N-methylhydantoinase A/oxoprolinase/acetone carboxylase beta subunit